MSLPLNQIVCGDCLDVMKAFPSESINLLVFDPPYNIGKAEWDKITDYYGWLLSCFKEFNRLLKANGCLWIFHTSFPILAKLNSLIEEDTDFRFRQFITINKGLQSIAGRTSEDLRSFPRATEYVLFYTFEDQTGAQQLSDTYSKLNPMATYLKTELERARVGFKEIAEAGHFYGNVNHGGSISNWVQGLSFPSKTQYEKMRDYLNSKIVGQRFLEKDYTYLEKSYEDLKKDYEFLRIEYEDLRYAFNLEKGVTDVWNICFYEETFNHPTVKPLKLLDRIVKTTSKIHSLVLDPCCGTGTTCVASKRYERNYIGIDNNPRYCEIARKRLASIPEKLEAFMEVNS